MQTDEATLRKTVAKNIAQYRKAHHDTQLDLATKLNYSDKAVSKWEQGESLPGIEVLYKLAKLYGVSMDYIVGEKEVKPARAAFGGLTQKRKRIITLLSFPGFLEALLFCLRSLLCFCLSVLALEISKTANAANKEMRVSHKEMFRNKMLIYTITRFFAIFHAIFSKKDSPPQTHSCRRLSL